MENDSGDRHQDEFPEAIFPTQGSAEELLKKLYFRAPHSRITQVVDAVTTATRHWDGVLRWFESRMTNGLLEGPIIRIQAAMAKARGYRSTKNLITMIYIIPGKFDSRLPT